MRTVIFILILFPFSIYAQEIFDSSFVKSKTVFLFASGEDTLQNSELRKIDSLYEIFNKFKNAYFDVEAHTDNVGSLTFNEALSLRRKGTIENRLISLGVNKEKIKGSYFGELNPRTSNEDDYGKSLNRRAELKLIVTKKMVRLTGRVVDEETSEGIPSEVELRSRDFVIKTKTSRDGTFSIPAPYRDVVGLEIFADNYFFKTEMLRVTPEALKNKTEISLPRIEIGKAFIMEKLFFEGNRSVLLPNSERELPRILKFMVQNSNTCIEIAGNINLPNRDSTKIEDIHYQLSVARSLEIFDYLVNSGISKDRLLARGYGNWRMIFPKAKKEKQMSKNRRVEIGIMHCSETKGIPNDSIPNQIYFKTATNLLRRI